MKYVNCEKYDDCMRACISMLTGLDDVPHVFSKDSDTEKSYEQLREYLKTHGKFLVLLTVNDPWEEMALNNPDIPYMLLCQNRRGVDHAVVCRNGKIFHDPAWYRSEIVGPHSSGYWIVGLIGELPS